MAGSAIAMFACGGKIAPGTSISNVDACALPNVCTVLSSAQVSAAMGSGFSAGAPETPGSANSSPTCAFSDASGVTQTEVSVLFDCPHQNSDDLKAGFAQQISFGAVSVSGVGDDAIWVPQSNVLGVIVGQNAFAVAIAFSFEGTDETQAQAEAIAQDVIANL